MAKQYAITGRRDRKKTRLGLLAAMYMDMERLRVAQQVRQSHLREDGSPFADDPIFQTVFAALKAGQDAVDDQMMPLVTGHPCWTEFNLHVKGVGPHLLALVMGLVRDVAPLTNVSKMWWLCGLGVTPEGKAVRATKGQITNFDMRLKSVLLGRIGTQLLMNGDPFARHLYDEFRAKYVAKHDGDETGAHRWAIRKVIKLWVACLWDVWRRAEGLPVTPHYAEVHQGHTGSTITAGEWVAYNAEVKRAKTAA